MTTPNMGLSFPVRGPSGSGLWGDTLDADNTLIDAHDHTTGKGSRVPVAGLNINDDISFSSLYAVTNTTRVQFSAIAASGLTGKDRSLFVSDGTSGLSAEELYYRDSSGRNRKITNQPFIDVRSYGALGTMAVDDGPAIQAAITANPGRVIFFPQPSVGYRIDSTIFIATESIHLVGEFNARVAQHGTQIKYMGTGPCFQIGVDNGLAWDVSLYDGPQGHSFEYLCISHGAPDTPIASNPGGNQVKAGSYGIWDWRGGDITMRSVQIEHFDANFVGIQSDFNRFLDCRCLQSRYGFYFGPRTDQNRMFHCDFVSCDRAVTVDRAGQLEMIGCTMEFCGTDTSSHVEVRQGSHGIISYGTWHENSGFGFAGNMQSFYSLGEVAGYGSGGSVSSPGGTPTTTAVAGCVVQNPHCYNLPAGAYHTKYLISVHKCNQVDLDHPTEYINSGLSSFDCLVAIQAGNVPTTTDTQIIVRGQPPSMTRTQVFQNLGGGAVRAAIESYGNYDAVTLGLDTTASHTVRGVINHASPTGATGFATSNTNTGQVAGSVIWRLTSSGSYDTTGGAIFPVALVISDTSTRSAGAASLGKTGVSIDVLNGQSNTALTTTRGDCFINQSGGLFQLARSLYLSNRLAPAAIGANQTDYNPGLTDVFMLRLTSSANVDINSIAFNANSAGGRLCYIRNDNAAGGFNITLKDEAAALGTASFRIQGNGHADVVLAPGNGRFGWYDSTLSRLTLL